MKLRIRTALTALTVVALASAGSAGLANAARTDDGGHSSHATKVFLLDPSVSGNNPEGVAWDRTSRSFFVGTVGTGTIYRASRHDTTLTPFITPGAGNSSVGMKVSGDRLFVAGGTTGSIYVYSISTGAPLARFETGAGGFLNDLVVTPRGDVYVTDSQRPTLWHLTPAMAAGGTGTPEAIPVGPEIAYVPGFNLNGIVSRRGGDELIVVNTATQSLFRIVFDDSTSGRTITQITAPPLAGDGLLKDRGRLLVVTGDPAAVTVLKLSRHDSLARTDKVITDPSLKGPSTIARASSRYLVVNADFAGNEQPYTVSALSRHHGGDHGH